MKPLLVLGIGSRLMMDDGIGVYVVEALRKEKFYNEWIAYEIGETDFNYCMDVVIDAEYVIIIDAAISGKNPGDVSVFSLSELSSSKPGISLHNVHFLDLLHQFHHKKKGVLLGIEPFQIDFHWGLSMELSQTFDDIVVQVKRIIELLNREFRLEEQR